MKIQINHSVIQAVLLVKLPLIIASTVVFSACGNRIVTVVGDSSTSALQISPAASSVAVAESTSVVVTAETSSGSAMSNYIGTVTLTSTDSKATLPPPHVYSLDNGGVYKFPGVKFGTSGWQTLTATDNVGNVATTTIQVGVTALNQSISITPSTTTPTISTPISAMVAPLDATQSDMKNYNGTITFTSSDSLATLPGSHTFAQADTGTYTASFTFRTLGWQTLTATADSGVSATVTFNVLSAGSCTGSSQTFSYLGVDQTFTPVSSGCTNVTARLWAAGGGGRGGNVTATMALTYGSTYTVIVGESGTDNYNSVNATNYGGGGCINQANAQLGWCGGGRTAIQLSSVDILTAGGGGAGYTYSSGGAGYPGGGTTGGGGARGGTQSAGGVGCVGHTIAQGPGESMGRYTGGIGAYGGGNLAGGGGGGYYGGLGGCYAGWGSSGGGGSSYLGSGFTSASTIGGTGTTAGNSTDLHLPVQTPSVGSGGTGLTASTYAGSGYAVLYWVASVTSTSHSGSIFTVTGFNLTSDTTVSIGGVSCTPVTFVSADQITCTIGGGTPTGSNAIITVPGYSAITVNSVY